MKKLPLSIKLICQLQNVEDLIDLCIACRDDRSDIVSEQDYYVLLDLRSSLSNSLDLLISGLNEVDYLSPDFRIELNKAIAL